MQENTTPSIKCVHCGIMLVGKEQFMGHMIHHHELDYGQLEHLWYRTNMTATMTTRPAKGEHTEIKIPEVQLEDRKVMRN